MQSIQGQACTQEVGGITLVLCILHNLTMTQEASLNQQSLNSNCQTWASIHSRWLLLLAMNGGTWHHHNKATKKERGKIDTMNAIPDDQLILDFCFLSSLPCENMGVSSCFYLACPHSQLILATILVINIHILLITKLWLKPAITPHIHVHIHTCTHTYMYIHVV